MGDISIRKSIRWFPDERSEPTSTVVLTSPAKRFVDVRFLLPSHEGEDSRKKHDGSYPPDALDWAFAGYSSSEERVGEDGKRTTHSTWKHSIDSRTLSADTVVDEGDMVTLPDGTTLETGRMVNPGTGVETDYEEVWESADAFPGADSELPEKYRGAEGGFCCVLETAGDQAGLGMVIRLGQYCQGILRTGEEVCVERWEWSDDGGWRATVRVGDEGGLGPVMERLTRGTSADVPPGEMTIGDVRWRVVEM